MSVLSPTKRKLVNNAVSAYFISSLDTTKEQAESTFQVNVLGALYMVQAVVPHMPRGGRIINISTVASKIGPDILSVYGASKAALDSLTYSWAGEVRSTHYRGSRPERTTQLIQL